jgi:hypothetical protein
VIPLTGSRTLVHRLAKELGLNTTVPYRAWFAGKQVNSWSKGSKMTFSKRPYQNIDSVLPFRLVVGLRFMVTSSHLLPSEAHLMKLHFHSLRDHSCYLSHSYRANTYLKFSDELLRYCKLQSDNVEILCIYGMRFMISRSILCFCRKEKKM